MDNKISDNNFIKTTQNFFAMNDKDWVYTGEAKKYKDKRLNPG